MPRQSDTRQKMILSQALLQRERGVAGTALPDVLEHSGAPRGSIYHHFPRGKAQLVEEATRYAGEVVARGLARALDGDDPAAALHAFVATWEAVLRGSDFEAGCSVVAATLEGDRSPAARDQAAAAFARWEELYAGALERRGVGADRARSLATLAVAAIEGAVVLARARRSPEPLRRVARELEDLTLTVVRPPTPPSGGR
jgi:TetR/AcrR family transcriptional repressor of lmrAB and yxaGH operons